MKERRKRKRSGKGVEARDIKDVIRGMKEEANFFCLMDDVEIDEIAGYFESSRHEAGEILFGEGEEGNFLAIVKSGRLQVKKETEFKGKQIVIAEVGRGSLIGELSVFDTKPRSATAAFMEDSELIILRNGSLGKLLEASPRVGNKFLVGICRTLSIRLRQSGQRLAVLF